MRISGLILKDSDFVGRGKDGRHGSESSILVFLTLVVFEAFFETLG